MDQLLNYHLNSMFNYFTYLLWYFFQDLRCTVSQINGLSVFKSLHIKWRWRLNQNFKFEGTLALLFDMMWYDVPTQWTLGWRITHIWLMESGTWLIQSYLWLLMLMSILLSFFKPLIIFHKSETLSESLPPSFPSL